MHSVCLSVCLSSFFLSRIVAYFLFCCCMWIITCLLSASSWYVSYISDFVLCDEKQNLCICDHPLKLKAHHRYFVRLVTIVEYRPTLSRRKLLWVKVQTLSIWIDDKRYFSHYLDTIFRLKNFVKMDLELMEPSLFCIKVKLMDCIPSFVRVIFAHARLCLGIELK